MSDSLSCSKYIVFPTFLIVELSDKKVQDRIFELMPKSILFFESDTTTAYFTQGISPSPNYSYYFHV